MADARTYVASLGVTQKANMAKSMMSAGQQSGTGASDAAGAGAAGVAGAAGAGDQGRRHGRDERTAARRQFRRVYRHGFERRACRDLRYVSTGTYDDNLATHSVW